MSSRQDEKRRRRAAREAAELRAATSSARRRRMAMVVATAGAVAVLAATTALLLGGPVPSHDASPIAAAPIPAQRVEDLDDAVRLASARRVSHPYAFGIGQHTGDVVAYPTNPPANGPHAFGWTPDGNHAGRPVPPTGEVVHAQEHGRVVFQYRPGVSAEVLAQLVALYEESPEHVLLVENATSMPCDVAATAWGQAVLCPTFTERSLDALRAFRDRFRDRGPELVA